MDKYVIAGGRVRMLDYSNVELAIGINPATYSSFDSAERALHEQQESHRRRCVFAVLCVAAVAAIAFGL